ncbi:hypothetical protein KPA96_13775 [Burkholderia cenocepacia]|uniref:hypothetical protein n=1 Tax=Burkholderia cenocepacia TaxID=95486 RepID=UPI0028629F72|nr:hypothetical protein [Burkholderia cenocepacia]MDR8076726.1 hypothetical protein [Burkholderia cenocepacia]
MNFIKRHILSRRIQKFFKEYSIEAKFKVNKEGLVDVEGVIDLSGWDFDSIPIPFGKIEGAFHMSDNNLIDLKNSPRHVDGDFSCDNNNIETLEGGPTYVSGDFDCRNNKLISLDYAPEECRSINASYNKISSVKSNTMKSVECLYLSCNEIVNLNGIENLNKMPETMFFAHNKIDNIDALMELHGNKSTLVLDSNMLEHIPNLTEPIKVLTISNNPLTKLSPVTSSLVILETNSEIIDDIFKNIYSEEYITEYSNPALKKYMSDAQIAGLCDYADKILLIGDMVVISHSEMSKAIGMRDLYHELIEKQKAEQLKPVGSSNKDEVLSSGGKMLPEIISQMKPKGNVSQTKNARMKI